MSFVLPYQQTPEGCRVEGRNHLGVTVDGIPVGIQVHRPRAGLGLNVLRIPRFGRDIPADKIHPVIRRLVSLAQERLVLRLHVEAWTEDVAQMNRIAECCEEAGFAPVSSRSYRETIWINLARTEQELLASFHHTVRRHIRPRIEDGLTVLPIQSVAWAGRIDALMHESFARTGGCPPAIDWELMIQQSQSDPDRAHMVGLFKDTAASTRLLAFALALRHGSVAEYAHAGSTRDPDLRVPLLYAPTWELMRWAKHSGARWWDFGGVPRGSSLAGGAVEGITDFKQYFSKNVVPVGREWALAPRPYLSKISLVLDGLARLSPFR